MLLRVIAGGLTRRGKRRREHALAVAHERGAVRRRSPLRCTRRRDMSTYHAIMLDERLMIVQENSAAAVGRCRKERVHSTSLENGCHQAAEQGRTL